MSELVCYRRCKACGRSECLAGSSRFCWFCGEAFADMKRPLQTSLVPPLAVGDCHESMAKIENADGFVVAKLKASTLLLQPPPDETAQALVDAFNATHKDAECET